MKIILICPVCKNTSFELKDYKRFYNKKDEKIICSKCASAHFIGELVVGLVREKEDNK